MHSISNGILIFMVATLFVGWAVFVAFFVGKKPKRMEEQRSDKRSLAGLALQGIGIGIVWSVRRPWLTPFANVGVVWSALLAIVNLSLIVGSIVLVTTAVRALGKQWGLAARVVKEHELIIEGPFKLVRHPIYTGMMGMLLATGLTISSVPTLVVGLIVFLIGTVIRVKLEEGLMRAAFGARYDDYAARVPALIPCWLKTRSLGLLALVLLALPGCQSSRKYTEPAPETYQSASFSVEIDGASKTISGAIVGPEFFTATGVRPMLGRSLLSDDRGNADSVVLISEKLWRDALGGDPAVIGHRISIDGKARIIVGIMPRSFDSPPNALLWTPEAARNQK